MRIGELEIGPGQPCRVVAELSNAHNGSLDRMLRLMHAAKLAGADILKWQTYTPDELVALRGDGPAPAPWNDRSMRDLYTQAQTPLPWLPQLVSEAHRLRLPWFSSVFGPESLAALQAVSCPAYKIAALDAQCMPLAGVVEATHQPFLVSVHAGAAAASAYRDGLIYCPAGYPPPLGNLQLRRLATGMYLGLSCHSRDRGVPATAVALGAKYLEVHVHLQAEPSALEANVSWDEHEFAALVDSVRHTEHLLG